MYNFGTSKAPRSLEIVTRNLREVVGRGPTRAGKDLVFAGSDQGQVGGPEQPVVSHGA